MEFLGLQNLASAGECCQLLLEWILNWGWREIFQRWQGLLLRQELIGHQDDDLPYFIGLSACGSFSGPVGTGF
ncbi:hypothetical protein N8I74_19230 [Chitiniphilus purpureus]|uniref:Uncharacterized protein n=1 Tax=Chitiniphilus purpureus TaxID=2981137 RepID=A0ABY6DPL1_9NEIS|nr:hypothetical protein [Chitiniphilus sp. CD1]UXY15416.1 hypothetical protein N8I74_19230 [Chitiniphilus sp. CD1]